MKIEQIYTGCLAQGAYYIESKGEVAIIDPLRETKPYIDKAENDGSIIKYIFETHFHADFVSGHVSLAKLTGAEIVFGPNADPSYNIISAKDGQEFKLGDIRIKVLHTPGHTMESSCFLLIDENGNDNALFSGDTLLIEDVGRPDLASKSDLSVADLASHLFDSLRNKIMPLANNIIIYPAHGSGSACGKNMSKETFDFLGNQKENNYALRHDMTRNEFIKKVTENMVPPPIYFPKNVKMNKEGYEDIDVILTKGTEPLSVVDFENIVNSEGALMLDTRKPQIFKDGFIPNSINIGIDGGFAPWVGALVPDLKQPIVLIVDEGRAEEVVTRLSRVGYDNTLGFIEGGFDTWEKAGKEVDSIVSISAIEFVSKIDEDINIIDSRKNNEYTSQRIDSDRLIHSPLREINDNFTSFDKNTEYHIHCGGGYRSMIMASILKSRGFEKIVEVAGGFGAIKKTDVKLTEFICLSKV